MKVFTKIGNEFPRAPSQKPELIYMWGAKELDRAETSFFNTTFKGDVVWDAEFTKNFHEVENQAFALSTCLKIKETKEVFVNIKKEQWCPKDPSLPLPAKVVSDETISCWAIDFKEFIESNPLKVVTSAVGDPVTTEDVIGSNVFPMTDKLMFYKQLVKWITTTEKGRKQFGSDFGINFSSLIKNPAFVSNYKQMKMAIEAAMKAAAAKKAEFEKNFVGTPEEKKAAL